VVSPNGTFIVNGTQELADGTNYFWLAYDVPASATLNNVLDAQCTSLTVGGTSRTLTATNPTGTRKIILIYCEAGANASNVAAWDRITNVTIGTINKTSTSESPAYADYTSFSTEANAGSTVNFTITTAGHDSTDKLLIWIDYNGDGDFDDSGENVYTSTESFSSPKSGSFVIPANTIAGAKRMRIRLNYPTGNTTPCGYSLYGEVEDYTINVLAPEINVKQATDIADAGIYNFGNIATGSNSGAITFTIENKGTASLSLSGTPKVAITGTNASDFTIVQSGLTSSISAGINQTFTISFAPGGTGLRTAAISIANNDADENPYNITLNGTGTAAATAEMNVKQNTTNIADAGSFSFGNVNMLSSSGILTFTIENTGDANLTLSGTPKILISGTHAADFAVVQTSTLSTVTAGSSTTFTINFTPSAFGTRIANISIANNDADENPYNFDITGMGVKLDQSITFVTLPAKTYGDVNFNLTATSTSGLAVTYTSSNTAVATVSGSTVHIVGQGNTIITATQTGNANYNPAPEQTQQLNVAKATLTVTAEGKSKVYGTTNPTFTVLYDGWKNGDNTSVITTPVSINSSATQFTQVGAYNIVPNGAAANNYDFAYVNGILNITKATLTVTADNQTKIQGTTNPTLTFTYSGWVNGQETIDTPPAISTTVNTATTVGTYNGSITVSGGLDNNYLFNYVPGNFIVTSSVVTITWTGTAWTPQAPTSTDDAIINGNYTIATGFECKNLTINQGKILQISPLTTVIVNENITNMGTIICKSNPATNDASGALLNRGEITGTGIYKAERNLKENSVQHYVGAPMMNVPYTIFAGNYYLRQLTSAATWTTVTSNLNNMQGYSVVFGRANKMLYFQNATGTAPFTTGNQVINTWNGQNLVANPYPTPIDWNAANGWSKTNISATIYFRNGNRLATWNGEVGVNGGTRYIPAMQGFVVASNGYSALEINNNAKVTNAQANQIFWKNSVNNIVRLNVEGGKYQGDEMVIVFNSDATDNYDMTHDGLKLFDEEENKYANIYTISNDNKQLCINYLPQTEVMDLYFNANETAVYTISATEMNLDFTDNVYLEDLFTGEFTDLSQANYSFTYNLNDTENRFRLHFNKTNAVEKTDIETVNIYSYNSDIYINSSATDGKVSVYSITGVELINCDLRKVINTNLANGIYTVKVTTLHGTYTANVFINK